MASRAPPLAALALALAAAPGCRATSAGRADPGREVLAVIEAQEAAWNRGDVEGFMETGYWRSPELAFLSGGDWTLGYDTVLERYRERYTRGGREMGRLEFTDLEVEPMGPDAALARGRWHLAFSDGSEAEGLFTLLFRRLPEGWRIVHDHTSAAR